MEALLAILVNDTQILACMTYGNRGIVVQNQSADQLTGDSPADEQYHILEGRKLLQIATIDNGKLDMVSEKARHISKEKKKEAILALKNIRDKKKERMSAFKNIVGMFRGKKPEDAT